MEILVSGVGRSGTTALYDFLTKYFEAQGIRSKSFYEPFLWGLEDREFVQPAAFDTTSAISIRGLATHCSIPLFAGEISVPKQFKEFVDQLRPQPNSEIWFCKCIRASGRLRWFLDCLPSLKVICIFRNPVSVLNSVLERFSFFGDEFHPSDTKRFYAELRDLGLIRESSIPKSEHLRLLDWWKYMNLSMMQLKGHYPESLYFLSQESLDAEPQKSYSEILRFVGLDTPSNLRSFARYDAHTAGNRLGPGVLNDALPYLDWYFRELLPLDQTGVEIKQGQLRDRIVLAHIKEPKKTSCNMPPADTQPLILRGRLGKVQVQLDELLAEKAQYEKRLRTEVDKALSTSFLGLILLIIRRLGRLISSLSSLARRGVKAVWVRLDGWRVGR